MNARDDAERLRRLQIVTDAALAHLALDDLLSELLERVREILEVDTAAILLLEPETKDLVARAAKGLEEEVERGVRVPFGRGFAGRVAAEQRPIILEDVARADIVNPLLREKGLKTMLGVPLVVEGRVTGILHTGSLVPRTFTPDDVELLQLAGDRAAIAIEHAHAFEAERRTRQRLENIQAITDAALDYLELDELLNALLVRIRDILHADTCAVLLLDPDRDELVARAAVGLEEEVERGVRIPVGHGFAGRIAARRETLKIDDVDQAELYSPTLRAKGIKTLLGAPLVLRGDAIGVVHVGSLTPRLFTPDEVELLQLLADRVAVAIERARLHTEIVQLDQLKLNFVAVASHELRTPATSIYGIALTLRERGDVLPQELRDELETTLWSESIRLRRLIEQLLDLSRLDAKAITVEPRPVVLRSLVQEIVAASEHPEQVQLEIDESLALNADPLAVERVLSNLLGNATRYGKPPVVVTATERDRHVRLVVEDAGPGISDELAPRLFERFERGSAGAGAGLGLAIAKTYAQAHGGDLLHVSGPGGARFELVLPRG